MSESRPQHSRRAGEAETRRRASDSRAAWIRRTGERPEAETPEVPTRPTNPLKRAVDVVLSALGLTATVPASAAFAVLIKAEGDGPLFHTQKRVGKGGELFTSYKFRSMTPREETGSPYGQAETEADRITPVGAFMRRCALDELPQLWNVLKGDMSLVGPRALLPAEVEARGDGEAVRLAELPGYAERHSVPPGLTGLAQTRAARDLPHRKKFRYDLLYVRNRSLWLDLTLIVQSVWISLTGRWPEVGRDSV